VSPSATLVPPAAANDRAGFGIEMADVTGDGHADVVVFCSHADVGGVADAGAIFLWHGGAPLSGTLAPSAVLHSATPTAGTGLGLYVGLLDDLDRDGVLDLVATMPDENAVHLWKGGASLSGTCFPNASLHPPSPAALGPSSVLVGDVTGDGHADIVTLGTSDGSTPTGFVFDGAALSGASVAPVVLAGAQGTSSSGLGLQLVDVTADGRLDVVTGDADRVRVFAGGALSGSVNPRASLVVPGTVADDQIGVCLGQGILFADLTGDGRTDIVAGARYEDVAGVHDAGALHVWRGGAALGGTKAPLLTATVPGAKPSDQLGY